MIENVTIGPCNASNYIQTSRMHYTQKGVNKAWDMVQVHDSVAVVLFHRDYNALMVVRQFRPPVYLKNDDGFTYELCAGIVDKDKSLLEIAHEEILEECGFHVPLEKIQKITSFYTAVGFAGSHQTLFFAEVDESMRIGDGGGVDAEEIEVIYVALEEARTFVLDESKAKTPGLMFGFGWFLENQNL